MVEFELIHEPAHCKTMASLRDWHNEQTITYLWICGVGCPAGREFRHDVQPADPEDYCNFDEFDLLDELWDLCGEVKGDTWCWDGIGDVTDERGNTIYNVQARR